jgi:uncharacterized iron-regulated membrane protein
MNFRVLNRQLHRKGALLAALPFCVVIVTGLLLQVKKQVAWVQPPEQRTEHVEPRLTFEAILAAAATRPEVGIRTWADVDRLDVRPGKGILKVLSTSRWEMQLDLATAEILQVAYRRSDLIESLHDGSWFHPNVKLWLFLPMGFVVLGLWLTGIYLWWLPIGVRRRKRADA